MTSAFGRNIRALRESNGMTQEQLADKLGVSRMTILNWERSDKKPRQKEVLQAIKALFNVTEQDLFGFGDGYYAKQTGLSGSVVAPGRPYTATAPVLGAIHAGDPQEAIENAGEEHELPQRVKDRFPDGFFLVVKGDSMNLILPEGCYAYIAPADQLPVKSGDVAAVKVNGDDATIKLVKLFDNVVILEPQSTNQSHKRRVIDADDPDAPDVRLLGKVVWFDYQMVKF